MTDLKTTCKSQPKVRLSVRLACWLCWLVLIALALEVSGRLTFSSWDNLYALRCSLGLQRALSLDEYEMPDTADPSFWRLRPRYAETLANAIASKKANGAVLGEQYLREQAKKLGVLEDEVIFQINSAGFKGPEFQLTKDRDGLQRVLCIGDSCTFGSLFDEHCYARSMEREFVALGQAAEVINAGVEGYSPKHVLKRIDELKQLRPDVTTIYIGWNALYDERKVALLGGAKFKSGAVWLISKIMGKVRSLAASSQENALAAYNKDRFPDRDAEELAAIGSVEFSFLSDVETIVDEMQSVGSRVVLITLPGLYTMNEAPTDEALRKGHLPEFTDNPYVVAKMAEVYNAWLRKFAATRDLQVIDLAEWSEQALVPREEYFFDSVHLYERGQALIGQKIACDLSSESEVVTVARN